MSTNANSYNQESFTQDNIHKNTKTLYDHDGFDKYGFDKNQYNHIGVHRTEVFIKLSEILDLYTKKFEYIASLLALYNDIKTSKEIKHTFLYSLVTVYNNPKTYIHKEFSNANEAYKQYIHEYIWYKIYDLEDYIDNSQPLEIQRKMWLLKLNFKHLIVNPDIVLPEFDNKIHGPKTNYINGEEYEYLFGQEGGYSDSSGIGDSSCISNWQYEGECYE